MALIRKGIAAVGASLTVLLPSAAVAADGYWLDQYNALLFMGLFRLDAELEEMKQKGAAVVMVHADSLPDPLLRWIAWRARRAGLQPVAWIQRPTPTNLKRVGALSSYSALQVDDHFFARPPVALSSLKASLAPRQLWCSFQPGQYSWRAAQHCDRGGRTPPGRPARAAGPPSRPEVRRSRPRSAPSARGRCSRGLA
jgi:hypothetical protein